MAYTEQQLKDAARKALAAGDTAAAKRFINAARAAGPQTQPLRQAAGTPAAVYNAPERTMGQTIYENLIGSGAVDTTGERIGEFIRGGGAAVARGLADVPALPANVLQLGAMGVEKLLGMEEPSAVSRGLAALPDTREALASIPVIGPESRYIAPGTAGEYIATGGEFAGGAGLMSGPRAMLKYGVAPGVASEAAGQATEGTALEPYARILAALAAPLAVGSLVKGTQAVVSPTAGQITPARKAAVETLRREGIQPTAGQVVGGRAAENQLYREAATAGGRARADQALEDFTSAVMTRVGAPAGTKATPEALEAATTRIGGVFDDVVKNVNVVPDQNVLVKMSDALKTYRDLAPKDTTPGIFENVNKALVDSFRNGNPIPASNLKVWRSTLSKLTKSVDDATREAAIDAVEAVDDAIELGLNLAGRPDDIARLATARNQYRNLLAIEGAAQRAGIEGVLSPLQLRNALLQQGRRRYVQGQGDLADITRAASDILKPLPQSGTAPRLTAGQLLPGAAGGTGAGLGAVGLGLDPLTATALGVTTALAPVVRNQFLSSGIGQRYFQNQLMPEFGPIVDQRMIGVVPGLLAQ